MLIQTSAFNQSGSSVCSETVDGDSDSFGSDVSVDTYIPFIHGLLSHKCLEIADSSLFSDLIRHDLFLLWLYEKCMYEDWPYLPSVIMPSVPWNSASSFAPAIPFTQRESWFCTVVHEAVMDLIISFYNERSSEPGLMSSVRKILLLTETSLSSSTFDSANALKATLAYSRNVHKARRTNVILGVLCSQLAGDCLDECLEVKKILSSLYPSSGSIQSGDASEQALGSAFRAIGHSLVGYAATKVAEGAQAALDENPAYTAASKVGAFAASSVVAVSDFVASFLETAPKLIPFIVVFAAWKFTRTGSVIWAAIAVLGAFQGGFFMARWFQSSIFPMLTRMWSARKPPVETKEGGTSTDISLGTEDFPETESIPSPLESILSAIGLGPKTLQPRPTAENQSLSLDSLSGILAAALLGSGLYMRDTTGLINTFTKFTAVSTGLAGVIGLVLQLLVTVREHLSPWCSMGFLPSFGKDVSSQQWCEEVRKIFILHSKHMLPKTHVTASSIANLIAAARQLLVDNPKSPLNVVVSQRLLKLEELERQLAPLVGKSSTTHPEAATCLIIGSTGTGKSNAAYALAKLLTREYLASQDPEAYEVCKLADGDFIFTAPEGKHWDGVGPRTVCVVWDDFYQTKPQYSEYPIGATYIRANGTQRWNPPFAALNSKNSVAISPVYSLASSNLTKLDDCTTLCVDAVGRRMDLIVQCVVKEGVALKDTTQFDPDANVYRVNRYNPQTSGFESIGMDLTFFEVAYMLEQQATKNRTWWENSNVNSESLIARYKEEKEKLSCLDVKLQDKVRKLLSSKGKSSPPSTISVAHNQAAGSEGLVRDGFDAPEDSTAFGIQQFKNGWADKHHEIATMGVILKAHEVFGKDFFRLGRGCYDVAQDEGCPGLLGYVIDPPDDPEEWIQEADPTTVLQHATTPVYAALQKLVSFIKEHSALLNAVLCGVAAASLAAFGISQIPPGWFSSEEQYYKTTMSDKDKAARQKAKDLARKTYVGPSIPAAANEAGLSLEESCKNVVWPNLYQISGLNADGVVALGSALGINEQNFLIPDHFLVNTCLAEPISMTIVSPKGASYTVPWSNIQTISQPSNSHDKAIIRLPKTVPPVSDIRKHFATDREISNAVLTGGATLSGALARPGFVDPFNRAFITPTLDILNSTDVRENCISYFKPTKVGDCGIPVIITASKAAGKIIGIHFSGNGINVGHAVSTSREWINSVTGRVEEPTSEPEILAVTIGPTVEQSPDPRDYHGSVEADYVTRHLSPPSNIFLVNNYIPWDNGHGPVYVDRLMAASDVNPRVFERNRARVTQSVCRDPRYSEFVTPIAAAIASNICKFSDYKPVVYSLKEVLLGVENTGITHLDATTSAGYPYEELGLPRRAFFSFNDRAQFQPGPHLDTLRHDVSFHLDQLKKGNFPSVLWKIILKGEKIKQAKFDEGKTRDVNAPPLWFLIICVMYIGGAIEKIRQGAPFNSFLIGVNEKNAASWNALTRTMKSVGNGKNCGSGDYKSYDHSHTPETLTLPCEVIEMLYPDSTPEDRLVRKAIFSYVTHPTFVFGSVVERRIGSMPSGFLGTTPFNCIINQGNFMYAFLKLHDYKLAYLPDFFTHVKAVFLGDDNLFSVSEEYKNSFTESKLAAVFSELGYTYTAADKGPAHEFNSPLENHTICKRGFRFDETFKTFVGPLNLARTLEIGLWTKRGLDADLIGADNLKTTISELSLHGEDVFNEWVPKIRTYAAHHWNLGVPNWKTQFSQTAEIH